MFDLHPDLLLYRGAGAHNLPVMLMALALGADPEWKHNGEGMQTAIHQAVRQLLSITNIYMNMFGSV